MAVKKQGEVIEVKPVFKPLKKLDKKPQVRAKIIEARGLGLSYKQSAAYAGVSLNTLDRYKANNPEFDLQLEQAKGETNHKLVKRLFDIATDPDPKSTMAQVQALGLILPALMPEAFSKQEKQGDTIINLNQFIGQQPEQIRQRLASVFNSSQPSN